MENSTAYHHKATLTSAGKHAQRFVSEEGKGPAISTNVAIDSSGMISKEPSQTSPISLGQMFESSLWDLAAEAPKPTAGMPGKLRSSGQVRSSTLNQATSNQNNNKKLGFWSSPKEIENDIKKLFDLRNQAAMILGGVSKLPKVPSIFKTTFGMAGSKTTQGANPKYRVKHVAHKAELRQNMQKPAVKDPKPRDFIDELYRPNAVIGSGGTADAIREELRTGTQVGNKFHLEKGKNSLTYLNKWIQNNPTASPGDRGAVEN